MMDCTTLSSYPLPWDQLDSSKVMDTIEKVLNSHQNLAVDKSMDIAVGIVDLPKGGARKRITKIKGDNNSLKLKMSIVTIENGDQLCMARAIGVSWAKLNLCTTEEWAEIIKTRGTKSNLQLVLENKKVPESYFKQVRSKQRNEQGQLAKAISQMAGVPMDRPASLNDIEAFEKVLGVRVMVFSAQLGNKFITSPSTDERPCIYVYLVDDDHYYAVTTITGFFSSRYFCQKCLKYYDHKEYHQCDIRCIVCKTDNCPKTDSPLKCTPCIMDCRSDKCYENHKKVPLHKKEPKKDKPVDHPNAKSGGNTPHVTK